MSDKLNEVVLRIFSMTHEGTLEWHPAVPPALWTKATDSVFPLYFETTYQDRRMALFEERFRRSKPDKRLGLTFDDGEWGVAARLVLLGPNGEVMFEFPSSREVNGLLDAVRYKTANVDDFFDEILKTEMIGNRP